MTKPLDEILPKLRSAIAAMDRLNYTDVVGVLRSGLDWSVSEGGQRRSLNAGDMRALLAEIERLRAALLRIAKREYDGVHDTDMVMASIAQQALGLPMDLLGIPDEPSEQLYRLVPLCLDEPSEKSSEQQPESSAPQGEAGDRAGPRVSPAAGLGSNPPGSSSMKAGEGQ